MAETKSPHESALHVKRKSDLTSQDHDPQRNLPHKSPKLQTQDEIIQPTEENHALLPYGNNDSSVSGPGPENRDPGIDSGEGEAEDDDDYEEDDANEEEGNGSTPVDRKGKGILIEEENDSDDEDDDGDDSSDGGAESEGESDLSDDPLAEVDLDNILPSRTRRRVVRPGVHIAKEVGNKGEADDNDDSDS
ncbi:Long chain base2 isoform 1 [Hibiscus syriacus]|uniref:Long chain base2 isoform 1 n=1 Tax=Hibiscus syriacus TaxID=106335 RepID=A0A6A3ASH6_HIBSY|nr:nucleolin-like [Hibiscus syriacus]KAE8707660.1 Long chain base2 isoform 1 [Hibiscus syriacus]